MNIKVDISIGELIDKITILEIKQKKYWLRKSFDLHLRHLVLENKSKWGNHLVVDHPIAFFFDPFLC